jgi:WD40 repeat protein
MTCQAQYRLKPTSAPAIISACHTDIIAVADGRSDDVMLFTGLEDISTMKTHHLTVGSTVTAMCISTNSTPYLFTCSSRGVERWVLSFSESVSLLVDTGGIPPPENVLSETLDGVPVHLSINKRSDMLIGCIDTFAIVISTVSGRITMRLEGHTAAVTAAAFRHDHENSAVTISEDRRFIVYDLSSASILFQSSIVSASPFVSLAVQECGSYCAIGSSDGKARIYDLSTPGCRLTHTFDIPAITGAISAHFLSAEGGREGGREGGKGKE